MRVSGVAVVVVVLVSGASPPLLLLLLLMPLLTVLLNEVIRHDPPLTPSHDPATECDQDPGQAV